ncbi:Fic family protein [bacterium]|nr:MAG: Fic family protein [bacterium]
MKLYIHQLDQWPNFTWQTNEFLNSLSEVRNLQGRLMGKMEALGFELRNEAQLETFTLDVLKSSEIEGEHLDLNEVRSSIAKKLGFELSDSIDSDRNVDGVVEMTLDATQHCFDPLSKERLFNWHAALFPTGRSGLHRITVADWRTDNNGPMRVISGTMNKVNIHFQAPDATLLDQYMDQFLTWFNTEHTLDLVLKAAIAHLWFITIHPFDDGNGRIARALTDLLLARSDKSNQRFYSMSAQIRIERKQYYDILEKTQKGDLNITVWLNWFLSCLTNALRATDTLLNRVLQKAEFWRTHAKTSLNERQKKLVNKLLDGFEGKLTSSKWAKIAKCSKDTAIRDINDLILKDVLQKELAGGRSTNYELKKNS